MGGCPTPTPATNVPSSRRHASCHRREQRDMGGRLAWRICGAGLAADVRARARAGGSPANTEWAAWPDPGTGVCGVTGKEAGPVNWQPQSTPVGGLARSQEVGRRWSWVEAPRHQWAITRCAGERSIEKTAEQISRRTGCGTSRCDARCDPAGRRLGCGAVIAPRSLRCLLPLLLQLWLARAPSRHDVETA